MARGSNLYGTTYCDGDYSAGDGLKLTPSGGTWTYTSLYVFTGGTNGNFLYSNLVFDKQGNLYGTTSEGGPDYEGMVFQIKP